MPIIEEVFYGLQCDFPDCKTVFDDGEYVYWNSPWENDYQAEDAGWLVDRDADRIFCPDHVVAHTCEVEGCDYCDEHNTDTHLEPLEDTPANRLAVIEKRVVTEAHRKLDYRFRELFDSSGYYRQNPSLTEQFKHIDRMLVATWKKAIKENVAGTIQIDGTTVHQLEMSTKAGGDAWASR